MDYVKNSKVYGKVAKVYGKVAKVYGKVHSTGEKYVAKAKIILLSPIQSIPAISINPFASDIKPSLGLVPPPPF